MNRIVIRPQGLGLVLVLMLIVFTAFDLTILALHPEKRTIIHMAGFAFIFLLTLIFCINYLGSRIIIDNDEVIYETGIRSYLFNLKNVKSVSISKQINGHTGTAMYYLLIHVNEKNIFIYLKSYSKKSLVQLVSVLINSCSNASIDDNVYKIAEGKRLPVY